MLGCVVAVCGLLPGSVVTEADAIGARQAFPGQTCAVPWERCGRPMQLLAPPIHRGAHSHPPPIILFCSLILCLATTLRRAVVTFSLD